MAHSERFVRLVDNARLLVKEITPEETRERVADGALLIDTREDHEWERGHVESATHLSRGILERDIEGVAPDLDREIILYCGGGFRSVLAAESLAKMGYTNVSSMSGGWKGWQARSFPIAGAGPPDA